LLRLQLVDYLASKKRCATKPGTLLVVKLDAIGDYVLFRNFLAEIKKSSLFKGYQITLCGNSVWKDFAEQLDVPYVDDFIWIDRNRFYADYDYRSEILKAVNNSGFEAVLQTSHSREYFFCDAVVKASRAHVKIGPFGDTRNITRKAKFFSDRYYSKLIKHTGSENFEFYRNREFFGKVFETDIALKAPLLDVSGISFAGGVDTPYAIIFPGAGEKFRRWPAVKFSEIADFLADSYGLQVMIAGSSEDTLLAREIISAATTSRIIDMTGRMSLPELAKMISRSELLVSNDTGAVHIAVAVGAKAVCISNGNHFGRFHPYPVDAAAKAAFVYPPEIMEQFAEPAKLYAAYGGGSTLDIDTISVPLVKRSIDALLGAN